MNQNLSKLLDRAISSKQIQAAVDQEPLFPTNHWDLGLVKITMYCPDVRSKFAQI